MMRDSKKSDTKKAVIPYPFVLEALSGRSLEIKPMFGCFAIYTGEKIVLILRDRKDHTFDNGVWVAITEEHYTELKKIFPTMRSIRVLGGKKTVWQNIPKSSEDFEEAVMRACELVLKSDPRIGKIPQRKKKKSELRKR